MPTYRISGLTRELTDEVRRTRRSPGFGHPVHAEIAKGDGPCRSCLGLFDVGHEERLLFTYAPPLAKSTPAPGPVFIHAEECPRYDGSRIPAALKVLPLLIEGRTDDGRILRSELTNGERAESIIQDFLGDPSIEFLFVRHGQAGCHIGRVDRVHS